MSTKVTLPPLQTYDDVYSNFLPSHFDYYKYPEKYRMDPFKIYGNLYYVGDKRVCSHIIDTGDGLILFDTGYAHTMHIFLKGIRDLGFRPEDIKIIIHSHGHFDHFGASARMKEMYGCKLYMGKPDADRIKINPDTALMDLSPEPYGPIPETDVTLNDGDIIRLGNTQIRCVLAPGHTEGVMAFFFKATDGKEEKQVGYWGGVGFLTIYKEHLQRYGLPMDLPLKMKETIKKLGKEKVEITLGNHPANNQTCEKRQFMLEHEGSNPFIDSEVWEELLSSIDEKLDRFLAKNY